MAYQDLRIVQAITQVMDGSIGSTRVVADGVFARGIHRDQEVPAKQAQALQTASATYRFDVELSPARSHDATPLSPSNKRVLELDVRIPIVRLAVIDLEYVALTADVSARNVLISSLRSAMDTAVLALTWPGNLSANQAGQATGVISGRMFGPGGQTDPERRNVTFDTDNNLLETEIVGRVILDVSD